MMLGILRRLDIEIKNLEAPGDPMLHGIGADEAGPAGYQYPRFEFVFQYEPGFPFCPPVT